VNDPNGVRCCDCYGDSYLLLQNVRLRTTFASKDTSNADVKLSCPEYYCHVLNEYADQELQDVISVALGIHRVVDSKSLSVYKEVQIHGPLVLNRDVEAIVVNKKYKGNKSMESMLYQFAETNMCNIIWME